MRRAKVGNASSRAIAPAPHTQTRNEHGPGEPPTRTQTCSFRRQSPATRPPLAPSFAAGPADPRRPSSPVLSRGLGLACLSDISPRAGTWHTPRSEPKPPVGTLTGQDATHQVGQSPPATDRTPCLACSSSLMPRSPSHTGPIPVSRDSYAAWP